MKVCRPLEFAVDGLHVVVELQGADAVQLAEAEMRLQFAAGFVRAVLVHAVETPAPARPAAHVAAPVPAPAAVESGPLSGFDPARKAAPPPRPRSPGASAAAAPAPDLAATGAALADEPEVDPLEEARGLGCLGTAQRTLARQLGHAASFQLRDEVSPVGAPVLLPDPCVRYWAVLRGSEPDARGIYCRWRNIRSPEAPSAYSALADGSCGVDFAAVYCGFASMEEVRVYVAAAGLAPLPVFP